MTPFQPDASAKAPWTSTTVGDPFAAVLMSTSLSFSAPYSPERPEGGADLLGEELRLLPGGQVATLVGLVEVDEGGVRLLGPAARGPPDLARERGEADRERDLRRSLAGRACLSQSSSVL